MLVLTQLVVVMQQRLDSLLVLFSARSVRGCLWRSQSFVTCRYFSGKKKEANSKGAQVPTIYS